MLEFDADDLARRYVAGESVKEIAESLGISANAVYDRLSTHGVKMRTTGESLELRTKMAIDMEEVSRRYLAGETLQMIADAAGVEASTIRLRLLRNGIATRKPGSYRKSDKINVDELARRFAAGETMADLAESCKVSPQTISRWFRERGIIEAGREAAGARRRKAVAADEIINLYRAGESELALSRRFNIARSGIRRRLTEAGITPRDGSKAMHLRHARMSPEDRLALAKNAHAAVRGVPQGEEYRCRIAATRQIRPINVSPNERTLAEWLRGRGLEVVPQQAVGRYNVDVAVAESRIAVEIFGGHWHMTGTHAARFRKRCDYLLDRGWLPVIVWITPSYRLSMEVADYVITLHESRCGGEPCRRQEHVIRGDGYVAEVSQINPDNGAIVMGYNPGNPVRREDGRFG